MICGERLVPSCNGRNNLDVVGHRSDPPGEWVHNQLLVVAGARRIFITRPSLTWAGVPAPRILKLTDCPGLSP